MLKYTYGKPKEYYEQIEKEFQSSPVYEKKFNESFSAEEENQLLNYICAVVRLEEMEEENGHCN